MSEKKTIDVWCSENLFHRLNGSASQLIAFANRALVVLKEGKAKRYRVTVEEIEEKEGAE